MSKSSEIGQTKTALLATILNIHALSVNNVDFVKKRMFWRQNLKNFDLQYDLFFENLKTTENMSLQFCYIYFLRRLIFVVLIYYCENYPGL